MANLIPLDENNQHRTEWWGSTNPSAVCGTDESMFTRWGVYCEKVLGMTLDLPLMTQGKHFEQGVISAGTERLAKVLGEGEHGDVREFLQGASVEKIKSKAKGEIHVSSYFTQDELETLPPNIAGECLNGRTVLKSNASPDFGFYQKSTSRKPFALGEAKLRIYADYKMMERQNNDPIPGLPGNGRPWYGEEFTCEVLPKEYDQCQWHLRHYPNCDRVYVFVTFNLKPEAGKIYVVHRDEARERQLCREIIMFNHFHVICENPPGEADRSDHCEWYLKTRKEVYPDIENATFEEELDAVKWAAAAEMATHFTKKAKALQNQLKSHIGERGGIQTEHGRITFKAGKDGTRRFNAKGFDRKNAAAEEGV